MFACRPSSMWRCYSDRNNAYNYKIVTQVFSNKRQEPSFVPSLGRAELTLRVNHGDRVMSLDALAVLPFLPLFFSTTPHTA
jgi:hypothetical protein